MYNVFGATTFLVTTLNIMGLFATLSINHTQHTSMECHYVECLVFKMLCQVSVTIANVLYWISLLWVSLCWMSLCRVCWRRNTPYFFSFFVFFYRQNVTRVQTLRTRSSGHRWVPDFVGAALQVPVQTSPSHLWTMLQVWNEWQNISELWECQLCKL